MSTPTAAATATAATTATAIVTAAVAAATVPLRKFRDINEAHNGLTGDEKSISIFAWGFSLKVPHGKSRSDRSESRFAILA